MNRYIPNISNIIVTLTFMLASLVLAFFVISNQAVHAQPIYPEYECPYCTYITVHPASAGRIDPDYPCPNCAVYGYDYDCYDPSCVNHPDGPHGVYELTRCIDCDGEVRYYRDLLFCHIYC